MNIGLAREKNKEIKVKLSHNPAKCSYFSWNINLNLKLYLNQNPNPTPN